MKRSTAVPGTFEAPMDTELMGLVASLFHLFTIFQRDNHSMACKLGGTVKNKHLSFRVGNGSLEPASGV